ncbi:MAG: hypothetical protein ACKVH8_04655 [Pirellulales bacterium]
MTIEPQIEITLDHENRQYQPDEEFKVRYQIRSIDPEEIQAVEASVLWYTEGTGEEDMSTHDFRRVLPIDVKNKVLIGSNTFQSRLPRSPLSYDGVIVKLHWVVRVRIFLSRGRETVQELEFQLGNLEPATLHVDEVPTKQGSKKNAAK